MAYATVDELQAGFRELTDNERALASSLLDEAAIIIDKYNCDADDKTRAIVSCRMVRRAIGDDVSFPMGASQGSVSAGGYTQSWTMGAGGTSGELYVSKQDKVLLGVSNRIGSHSPLEELV